MKQRKGMILLGFALLVTPGLVFAQSYTANFVATPPVIDGVVSPGEWDAAAPALGSDWTDHASATPADPAEPTKVRVLYSVDALYILYECTDTDVISVVSGSERLNSSLDGTPGKQASGTVGWTFANTDYLAIYLDPANVADDRTDVDPNNYSYSIQAEPSVSFFGEKDDWGNSYNYSEFGRWGGFRLRNPNPVNVGGVTQYWLGGGSWEIYNSQIVDGPTADGYVMEFRIPWEDLNYPYYQHVGSSIADNLIILDGEDAAVRNDASSLWGLAAVNGGDVTGMPQPGTVWKVQFCRHSASANPQYTNWVGNTGGFVSRPFGNLVFGAATGTAVREALLHN
ncbi:MAG: hypothetical protein C4527_14970 [Candidatus Omnitrophota bacterium]|jgi:hypothetical protein|nr:MAG: hypothetical protein C4527_14970 [Candidatus Omnitrophota bacterium]